MANNNFGTGINEWLRGYEYEIVVTLGPVGEPDQQITIIRRDDGVLAGETNGDPIWNDECEVLLSESE